MGRLIVSTYLDKLQEIAESMINETPKLAKLGLYDDSNLELELGRKLIKFVEEFCEEHYIR